MARPRKAKPPPPPSAPRPVAAPALAEALLLATVCMVGLPVEVQVRDGSAYAGVLHTASVDGGYGVVLKKARKIADGKGKANIPLGAFVDTLVVLLDDLVQVIAKDFSLPIKDFSGLDCNLVGARGSLNPQTSQANDPKMSKPENLSPNRQFDKCRTSGQDSDASIKKNAQTNVGTSCTMNRGTGSAIVGPKADAVTSSAIPAAMVASDVKNSQAVKIVVPSKTAAKEFKLNPCAKVFSPSFASQRNAPAAAPPVNPNYVLHPATEVPMGIPAFESKSVLDSSSLSSKVHYNSPSPANYGISPQYAQSIVGHNAARLDHTRVVTPYHPVQVGATYNSLSPHPVVNGKFSPIVYVHPVCQDAMHGTPVITQGWSRPALLNSYQAGLQKFQGNNPMYVAPPVMATGNLPMVVPSPAPLVQPFQTIHPIMVPAVSSMVPGKYM